VNTALVDVTAVGTDRLLIKLTVAGAERDIALVPEVLSAFERFLKKGYRFFIIDVRRIRELPPSFIVMMFEVTARARRLGGDVFVLNLRKGAKHHLLTFNPLSYLYTAEDEESVVREVSERNHVQTSSKNTESRSITESESMDSDKTAVDTKSIEIPSKVENLYEACDFVTEFARETGFVQEAIGKIKIAVYEACLNAIEHAYHSDPFRIVRVIVKRFPHKIAIHVIDQGIGFDVDEKGGFDIVKAANARHTGGMGLHIIKSSMDEIAYEKDPVVGNQLIMVKYFDKNDTDRHQINIS
jgi:serine/threonine-protein kinase RsbW